MKRTIKFLGITVYSHYKSCNKEKIKILGIPVCKRVYLPKSVKLYILGIRFSKRKYNHFQVIDDQFSKICTKKDADILNIAFVFDGGVGDYLISADFVYLFRKYVGYNKVRIDLFENGIKNILSHFFEDHKYVDNIYDAKIVSVDDYDLVIRCTRFPYVVKCDKQKISSFSEKLFSIIQSWEECCLRKERFIKAHPKLDGQLAIYDMLLGYHRYDQIDYQRKLKLNEKYALPIFIRKDWKDCLKKLGILDNFVTVHCGTDSRRLRHSTKEWSSEYFNELLWQIKKKYPEVQIVQLGIPFDTPFENTDLNLLGKTDIEDLKVILANSLIHIDIEGGLVHLRHALNGGSSIVLFGPTSPDFYGYPENINLKGNACSYCCEWMIENWQERCLKTNSYISMCLKSLTPDTVFEKFCSLYEEKNNV